MLKIGNLEVYGIVYKITNILNNKSYVGQTTKGFDKRYHNNLIKYTHNKHLKKSLITHGLENFKVTKVLDVAFSKKELNIKELSWISITNSYNKGYNYTLGGEGISGLPKEKHGMYGVHRYGKNNPFFGKKHTQETKRIISKSSSERIGELNPNYGKGDNIKGYKNPMFGISPQERMDNNTYNGWLLKMRENHCGGKNPNATKVRCITTGRLFDSIVEGARFYNISPDGIRQNCVHKSKYSGKLKSGEKLVWEYHKKQNKNIIEGLSQYINEGN